MFLEELDPLRAVGTVFTVVGVVFVLIFRWGLPVDVVPGSDRNSVTAQVVETQVNERVSVNGKHPTTVRCKYEVAGRWYQASTDVLNAPVLGDSPEATTACRVRALRAVLVPGRGVHSHDREEEQPGGLVPRPADRGPARGRLPRHPASQSAGREGCRR